MSLSTDLELQKLFLEKTPLIDVRSEGEFNSGIIPHSINLPILNNEERVLVGTCYKMEGQDEAIKLGHKLVTGDIKQRRISQWREQLERAPETKIFCFRGGLRSQITCGWLREVGFDVWPIEGGYKRLRNFFLSILDEAPFPQMKRLGGMTGSGKTRILRAQKSFIDLEELANHRGSAFGNIGAQPSQVTFENHLALELLRFQDQKIVIEDESVTIGKIALPQRFYKHLRSTPLYLLEVDLEQRIFNIFEDYVKHRTVDFFIDNLNRLEKRFGKVKVSGLAIEIQSAFSKPMILSNHEAWIADILQNYYDPLYRKDIKRHGHLIEFQGDEAALALQLRS